MSGAATEAVPAFRWGQFAWVAAAILVSGAGAAIALDDPHFFNRCGALVAALGAILVVVQIRFDMSVEAQYEAALERLSQPDGQISAPALQEAAERLRRAARLRAHDALMRSRTDAVLKVAAICACGELVHGWGDFAIVALQVLRHAVT